MGRGGGGVVGGGRGRGVTRGGRAGGGPSFFAVQRLCGAPLQ